MTSFVLKGREFLDAQGSELAHVRDEIRLPLTGHAKAQHQAEELDRSSIGPSRHAAQRNAGGGRRPH